ncbi:hypothetical protein LX36DRAFT_658359 [Colletotrichum falcatum]|nr:hypothetical protein LX36DRAFT_658359 [Colletotrichum falcatum]
MYANRLAASAGITLFPRPLAPVCWLSAVGWVAVLTSDHLLFSFFVQAMAFA